MFWSLWSHQAVPAQLSSQRRRHYVVVGPDPQVVVMASPQPEGDLWDHTSPQSSHFKPIPPSHLTFSLQLHRISHSLLDWNRFNGHLITFWMFIVPLLQHLHLLIPVTHFPSVKCLKMSEQNWSVSKVEHPYHPHLTLHPTLSYP